MRSTVLRVPALEKSAFVTVMGIIYLPVGRMNSYETTDFPNAVFQPHPRKHWGFNAVGLSYNL